jgi:site-specific DNA-methyltransferase (adenine-specific)
VCAIEDAGFEIRDGLMWMFGTGFPKSHDVSKGIDRANGDKRPVIGDGPFASRKPNGSARKCLAQCRKKPISSLQGPARDPSLKMPVNMASKLLARTSGLSA